MFQKKPKYYFGRQPKIYLPTPKLKKEIHFSWRPVQIFLILAVIGGLIYLFFYSPVFNIKNIQIQGEGSEKVAVFAEQAKGKNLWLYDTNSIKEESLRLAEVSDVTIKKWPPNLLKVTVSQKIEGIVWKTVDHKYLLDSKGMVLREIAETNLPIVVDSKNIPLSIGAQVVSPSFVSFIRELAFKFNSVSGLPIKEIQLPSETTFEIVVQTEGFKVIFDTQARIDQQLSNMVRVYQAKKDEIHEYMDLRIEGRVYYK